MRLPRRQGPSGSWPAALCRKWAARRRFSPSRHPSSRRQLAEWPSSPSLLPSSAEPARPACVQHGRPRRTMEVASVEGCDGTARRGPTARQRCWRRGCSATSTRPPPPQACVCAQRCEREQRDGEWCAHDFALLRMSRSASVRARIARRLEPPRSFAFNRSRPMLRVRAVSMRGAVVHVDGVGACDMMTT